MSKNKPNQMVFIGGGGSSGTHMLALQIAKYRGFYCGPEVRITHQAGLYFEDSFKRTLFKGILAQCPSNVFKLGEKTAYEIIPRYLFDNRAYYGIKTIDDVFDLYESSIDISSFLSTVGQGLIDAPTSASWTWVEHSPRNGIFAPLLLQQVPQAKFIHMIRDGRDAVLSQYKRFITRFPGAPKEKILSLSAHLWATCQWGALSSHQHSKAKVIRYESFVHNPETELDQLMSWLNSQAHLKFGSESVQGIEKAKEWSLNPHEQVSAAAVGKWKTGWAPGELKALMNLELILPNKDEHPIKFKDIQELLGYPSDLTEIKY